MKTKKISIAEHKLMKVCILTILTLFLLFFFVWASRYWNDLQGYRYEELVFSWVVISLFMNVVSIILCKKPKYIDMLLIFVLCSYLFMFGHVFFYIGNFQTTLLWNPAVYFSEIEKFRASVYAIFCLTFLSLGYIVGGEIKNKELNLYNLVKRKRDYQLGWLLVSVGFISSFLNEFKIISETLSSNSYISYGKVDTTGFLDDFSFLLVPGIVYVLSSKMLSKKKSLVLVSFSIIYFVLLMVFSGSRKIQLFSVITVILCYLWTQKKRNINIKKMIVVSIFGVIILNLLYVIRQTRFQLNSVLPTFFDSFVNFKFLGSIFGETFAESGLTFYSVVAITSNVPTVFPFEYGMTFVRTLPSIIPIGWLIGDFFNKASSSYVINRYTGLPVGTSLFGDFYWNFGFVGGVFCCFIMGIAISKFISYAMSEYNIALYFSVFYVLMIGIRAGVFELYRPMAIAVLIPYVLRFIIFNNKKYGG